MNRTPRRALLRPLSPLYSFATAARNAAYDQGLLRQQRLPATVISVGNLSTGGTGKTPLVIALAHLLAEADREPIILSRGYKRASSATERVDLDGNAARYGDEPLLLARATSAPVFIGADRYRAGQIAAEQIPVTAATFFLLDDGFQHRRLARDLDIVLLSSSDLHDSALPAGNLREPLSSLCRADALVFREEDATLAPQFLERFSRPSCGRPVLWTIRRTLDLSSLPAPDQPAVAFAGIAHPAEFFRNLRARKITLPATLAFPDHHPYSFADITRILTALHSAKCTMLLTTEKDFVRLDTKARAALESAATVIPIPLLTELLNPEVCLRQIEALCVRQS